MTRQGQSILEYVLLVGIVTLVLVYMGTDFKRGIQSAVKVTADQLGSQTNADQEFDSSVQQSILVNSLSRFAQTHQQAHGERFGILNQQQADTTETFTNSVTNIINPGSSN